MSDCYTPTDGEVLEAWAAHNTPDLPTALDLVAAYDAFKRWLSEHDAKVRAEVHALQETGLRENIERMEVERDNWKMSAEEAERAEKRAGKRADAAREEVGYEKRMREFISGERDRFIDLKRAADQRAAEYAAVVEKAEDFVTRHYLDTRFGGEVLPILASAGADVLREHDAALIEGLAEEVGYSLVRHEEAEAFLLREARQRREEQNRG